MRALDATVRTGLIVGPWDESPDRFARADACGADVLAPHVDLLDDELRAQALERAQPLLVWTVNDGADLARLIVDPALGCVITDVPDVALALCGRGPAP